MAMGMCVPVPLVAPSSGAPPGHRPARELVEEGVCPRTLRVHIEPRSRELLLRMLHAHRGGALDRGLARFVDQVLPNLLRRSFVHFTFSFLPPEVRVLRGTTAIGVPCAYRTVCRDFQPFKRPLWGTAPHQGEEVIPIVRGAPGDPFRRDT